MGLALSMDGINFPAFHHLPIYLIGENNMPMVAIKGIKRMEVPLNTPLTELDNYIPFGCRVGACGACVVEVIAGRENLSLMDEEEKIFLDELALGGLTYRLACQCKVFGDVEIMCDL
jgi:ferredoxin